MKTIQPVNRKQPATTARKHQPVQPATLQHQKPSTAVDTIRLQRVIANPSVANPADLAALQHKLGNRAVSHLIQTKLSVGPAHDHYEQEADRVAQQVMRMPEPIAVQRATAKEEVQTKPLAAAITPLVQRQETPEEEEVQTKPIVQREPEEEEEVQTRPIAQRSGAGGFEVNDTFERRLAASQGGGAPLPDPVRDFMEPRFGADFSGVRVHIGSEAAQLSKAVSAQAFTLGQDIYLGEGKTELDSEQGKQLLAHELTHVVQQTGRGPSSAVQRQPVIQRNGRDALPSILHLPAKTQLLLQSVLEKPTITQAVQQMYDNIWNLSGWKYNASALTINGADYISGAKDTGMCESYREAFHALLMVYDQLRKTHPNPAISGGTLNIAKGQALVQDRFMTRQGLTLMGPTALKGNVYLETDGNGTVVDQDRNSINRFVFKGHWTLIVNGAEYDPIFYSIDEDNIAEKVDAKYESNAIKLLPDTSRPIPTNEFGATFMLIGDHPTYKNNKAAIETFYNTNQRKIEALLSGSKWQQIKQGIFRPSKSSLPGQGQAALASITDLTTFGALAKKEAPQAFIKALKQVAALAGRSAELNATPVW